MVPRASWVDRLRSQAFASLQDTCAKQFKWKLVREFRIPAPKNKSIIVDSAVLDSFTLKLSSETPILNIELSLDEALKLALALDECCRKVNRYKMSNTTGKRARVCLALHFKPGRVVVYEGKAKQPEG